MTSHSPEAPAPGDGPAGERLVDPDTPAPPTSTPTPTPQGSSSDIAVLSAIAAGGVLGAEARYGIDRLIPHRGSGFPLSTLIINTVGCLLIGLLMATMAHRLKTNRLVRPFIGVGIIGGFTTFSTFAVDTDTLLRADRIPVAVGYVAATLTLGWLAVWAGLSVVRQLAPPTPVVKPR